METENEVQKLKEDYPGFFKQYSPDLLEFILSEKTASDIAEICLRNGIEDEEKIEQIANRVTLALLKEFPKEKLPEVLEKGMKLTRGISEKISAEINQKIFSKIRSATPEKGQPSQSKKEPLLTPGAMLLGEEKPEKS